MSHPRVEAALQQLEATADDFADRLIRVPEVRAEYGEQTRRVSESIRQAVASGSLSAQRGREIAHDMRSQIVDMMRTREREQAASLAVSLTAQGLALEHDIKNAIKRLGFEGRRFGQLSGEEMRRVLTEVVEASWHSRGTILAGVPNLRGAARGLWLATLLIAGYNIGTAEHPWWQAGREGVGIAGGIGGSLAGGAAGGALAGPIGVAAAIAGGILGTLLSDRAYIEATGTGDPVCRPFIARFTSFWRGVDEEAMGRALAEEYRTNLSFVRSVFFSLDRDYHVDADDVAARYVARVRKDPGLEQALCKDRALLGLLIRLLERGWTSSDEAESLRYLRQLLA